MKREDIKDLEFKSIKEIERAEEDIELIFRYVSDLLDIRCRLVDKIKSIDTELDHLIELCKGNYKDKL